MAVTYDENVIVAYAERLYRRAAFVIIAYTLLGALVGASVVEGLAITEQIHSSATNVVAAVVGVICAGLGAIVGSERAFALRLLAQQALCQLQIERNTRSLAPSLPRIANPPLGSPNLSGTW